MASSFAQKVLRTTLTLQGGSFGPNGDNSVVLQDLRVDAEIVKSGSPSKNEAKIKVWGMKREDMEALTTTSFRALGVRKSFMEIQAGDSDLLSTAFKGEITGAWVVLHEGQPYFRVESCSGYYPAIAPSSPRSFQGPTGVSGIMAGLASEMGYAFEDGGVDSLIGNPYLCGTAMQQAQALADAAGIEWGVDDGVLWIAPRDEARAGEAPLLSPSSGLIGYPTFDKEGLRARCLWTPSVQLGGLIQVQSSVKAACGTWRVHGLRHHLQALHPGGKWETQIAATWPKGA